MSNIFELTLRDDLSSQDVVVVVVVVVVVLVAKSGAGVMLSW